ncbi:MAG: hypothetical protein ACYTAS_02835, partial [Planctomycetota bacterium]
MTRKTQIAGRHPGPSAGARAEGLPSTPAAPDLALPICPASAGATLALRRQGRSAGAEMPQNRRPCAPIKPNRRRRPERRSGVSDRSRTDLPLALSSSAPNKPNLPGREITLNISHAITYNETG